MKEDFLHYIWQYQYFAKSELQTTAGEEVLVLKPGLYNTDAGPDFQMAQVKINGVSWNGAVEIHLKASDWIKHAHQHDCKYDQVILHVVWEADQEISLSDKTQVPTLELKNRVDPALLKTYNELMLTARNIPCEGVWPKVPDFTKTMMLERSLIERFTEKAEQVIAVLNESNHDWEETAYKTLLRSFGFKINQEGFTKLAASLPYNIIRRNRENLKNLEALLLGQAGYLNEIPEDDTYLAALQQTYRHFQNKYKFTPLQTRDWNLLRMRPANFPPVRLAQLSALLHKHPNLFAEILALNSIPEMEKFFAVKATEYWQQHYLPGRKSARKLTGIGKGSIHNLIINTVGLAVPMAVM